VEFAIEPLQDGQRLSLGEVTLEILATPGHTPSICVVVYEHPDDAVPYGLLTWDTLFVGRCGRPDAGVVGPTGRHTGAQTVSIAARQTAATARCHTERQPVRPHYFEFDACSSGRAAAPKSGVLALASILRCQLGWGSAGSERAGGSVGCVGGMGPSAAVSPVTSFQTANRRIIFGAMVVSGEAMAAGPEVRGNHAERPGTVGLRRAFSTGVPSGVIVTSSWTPFWSRIAASGLTRPAKTMTGTSWWRVSCAAPIGVLPRTVWASTLPSPVNTQSAPAMACCRSSVSATT